MSQPTDAISGAQFRKFEFSENFSSWTECTGWVATVEAGGGEREAGALNTADQSRPIVTLGDEAPETLSITGVYTEGVSELYRKARAAKQNGTKFWVRYSKSGTVGERRYVTDQNYSFVTQCNPPGRPGGGDPLTIQIVVTTAGIDEETIT